MTDKLKDDKLKTLEKFSLFVLTYFGQEVPEIPDVDNFPNLDHESLQNFLEDKFISDMTLITAQIDEAEAYAEHCKNLLHHYIPSLDNVQRRK